jgi:ABC-type sugar transport system ATPase subunit
VNDAVTAGREVSAAGQPLIAVRGVVKTFGAVKALRGVDLEVLAGEVHALIGENGAGKSTLGRVVAGVVRPDDGVIELLGSRVNYRGPREALADGIALLSQETTLVSMRSVLENVFLGREASGRFGGLRRSKMYAEFRRLQDLTGFSFDPDVPVGSLRIAQQQQVELLRTISLGSRLIVMDEPTAALTADESERLLDTLRALVARGIAVIYVSHSIDEILAIADRITVMRDGAVSWAGPASGQTHDRLVTAMLGRQLEAVQTGSGLRDGAPVAVSVEGLSVPGVLHDISFEIRSGEVLGVAGLMGSGQSELAHALFGALGRVQGTVRLDGRIVRYRRPRQAIADGVSLLPQSRRDQGLVLDRPVSENISLMHLDAVARAGIVRRKAEMEVVSRLIDDLSIRVAHPGMYCGSLSGGNQQKVLFAKLLTRPPKLLLLDEPTRGVDVGAKAAIYTLIAELARRGAAILLVSSDLGEVLRLSDRIITMKAGRVVGEVPREGATEEVVMRVAFTSEGSVA